MAMPRKRYRTGLRARCGRPGRVDAELHPLLKLWIFRLLVRLRGDRSFVTPLGFSDDSLAIALGLGDFVDTELEGFDAKAVLWQLRKLHRQAEREHGQVRPPQELERNVASLAGLANLTEAQARILEFAVLIQQEVALENAADQLGSLSTSQVYNVLATLLELPQVEVREALKGAGALARTGLLSIDTGSSTLHSKLDLLSPDFADRVMSNETDPLSFIRDTVVPASPPELALADFAHLAEPLKLMLAYLRHAIRTRRPGTNILLHGVPGTGKSQLARTLAKALRSPLFEVSAEDSDGDPTDGNRRLRSYRAAQCFFTSRKAMLLFDEVEDVFGQSTGLFGLMSRSSPHKAWINRTLEGNPVPAIWISNSPDCLDIAFIRRFDMVFELPVPPRGQRRRILAAACGTLLEADQLDRVAECEGLAPAIAARAASVVGAVRRSIAPAARAPAFELLVNNTLRAQGRSPVRRARNDRSDALYDLRYLNADVDIAAVTERLLSEKEGRICLCGPPGTGKTAWGTWLAGRLQMPLHVKRASDLLSEYVGGSEKNIAAAFRAAEGDGAILLIDEVDSFLRDRRRARAGWEVTQVNEMLTRMEDFPGLFIASTNLADGLDQAALRRFDLKVQFLPLTAEQGWALFRRHCDDMGFGQPAAGLGARLGRLENLTPGDFATVRRRARLDPLLSAAALAAALEAEVALKAGLGGGLGARLGFV